MEEIEFEVVGAPEKVMAPLDELARKTIEINYKPKTIKKIVYSISIRAIIEK